MSDVNRVFLIGRLGKDPEVRSLADGLQVCSLAVATSDAWTDRVSGEKKEKTEWHRVNVWGKQAEQCSKSLSKGALVCVEGSLNTRSYDKNGVKTYTTEIKALNVSFLGKGGGKSAETEHADGMAAAKKIASQLAGSRKHDDDLPF